MLHLLELAFGQRDLAGLRGSFIEPLGEGLRMACFQGANEGGLTFEICHRKSSRARRAQLVPVGCANEDQFAALEDFLASIDAMTARPLINPEEFWIIMVMQGMGGAAIPGKLEQISAHAGLGSPGETNHNNIERSEYDIKMSDSKT
jgi:hypothetical protein